MTSAAVTLGYMTQHKDSNGDDKPKTPSGIHRGGDGRTGDDWQDFLAAHSEDLGDVEASSTARKFERKARKADKQAALKASDLDRSAFVDSGPGAGRGPRDFSSSWLDVDEVMDQSSDFIPPNPDLGAPKATGILYTVLTLIGVLGLAASLFLPHPPSVLGPVFGLCTLIGIAGLIAGRRDFRQRRAPDDDGARV
ncbi:hypothetical protein BACT_0838 [Bifidobacterium actinocoloniiforme DSM 22766]|uniref:Membrane associated protein n=3 Tax=Bifidobacterium actinocoloniiforme TaxID=638619 RepID=A0A086Z0T6_9BIFI|nr:hypothetical protein BACT_0838 [Bifidobacterium actinocoloniiforme DSM 22766]